MDAFKQHFEHRHNKLFQALLQKPVCRRAYLQRIETPTLTKFRDAIIDAINKLSTVHHCMCHGRNISFGLIRLANIKTIIPFAEQLCEMLPNDYIAAYHSGEIKIHRFLKEQMLDRLLMRNNSNLDENEYLRNLILEKPEGAHIRFILLASPVEEIGRDHDFDWGIIEPSSSRSIVQTAGRINRHRQVKITHPNIAILQYNANRCRGGRPGHIFRYPGFEEAYYQYASNDISELLAWDGNEELNITSQLIDEHTHKFANYDSISIEKQLKGHKYFDPMCNAWMIAGIYEKYKLRDSDDGVDLYLDKNNNWVRRDNFGTIRSFKSSDIIQVAKNPPNTWLSWSIEEMKRACYDNNISPKDGMIKGFATDPTTSIIRKMIWIPALGFTYAKQYQEEKMKWI